MAEMYFNKFKIETNQNRSESIDRLKGIVCTDKQPIVSLNFDFKDKPFFGTITENKFEITPVIEGRNPFVPVLKGEVMGDNPSVIVVKMRLHFLMIAFLVILTILILWSLHYNMNNGGLIVLPIIYSTAIFLYLRESKKYKTKFEAYFRRTT